MKRALTSLLPLITFLLLGCSTDEDADNHKAIQGKWVLFRQQTETNFTYDSLNNPIEIPVERQDTTLNPASIDYKTAEFYHFSGDSLYHYTNIHHDSTYKENIYTFELSEDLLMIFGNKYNDTVTFRLEDKDEYLIITRETKEFSSPELSKYFDRQIDHYQHYTGDLPPSSWKGLQKRGLETVPFSRFFK